MKKWLKRFGVACLLELAVILVIGIEICIGEYVLHLTIDGLTYTEAYFMMLNTHPIMTAIGIGMIAAWSYFMANQIVK